MKRLIMVVLIAAVVVAICPALDPVVLNVTSLAVFVIIGLMPFVDRRGRPGWAIMAISAVGLMGVVQSIIHLVLLEGWLVVSPHANHLIHSELSFIGGLILGAIFTLMLAGQFFGAKRTG